MGDWIVRTHWAVAPDEVTALEVYERLEEIAAAIRAEGSYEGGASILRFGFGSPRLVVAIASQKWGESAAIEHALADVRGVELLVTDAGRFLVGSLAVLEPEYLFAWGADEVADAALARAGLAAVRAGAALVRALDAEAAAALLEEEGGRLRLAIPAWLAGSGPAPKELVVGVVSRAHGLVALGELYHAEEAGELAPGADAMQLYAQRIDGGNNSVVIRDYTKLLPPARLHDDVAWRMERHGLHFLFQSTAQRASMVRAALASTSPLEQRAGRAMMRRWGMDADGARLPAPCRPLGAGALAELPDVPAVQRYAGALGGGELWREALAGLARFREAGARLGELAGAGHDAALRELARRFAELAHAVSRTSYWMVRDGATGPDLPELPGGPLGTLWDGSPRHVAGQIRFWAAAAAIAMHERERHPAAAAAAALIALDAGLAAATGVWWVPAAGWLEAVVHAEVALDTDADIDPTIAADPDFDPARARAALARFVEGEALLDDDPPRAAAILEEAHAAARAAGANVLALRAHYRLLGALEPSSASARFTAEAERLLRDVPSPVSIFPLGTAGELAEAAIAWTANWLAWTAHERGDHARGLELIERALLFAKPAAWHDNIRDTKVRALLALGRADEAYAIVREVLARAPDFETFADLAASPAYRAWCGRAATP